MLVRRWFQMLLLCFSLGSLSAADIGGLWTGQMQGRFDKMEDISFQFQIKGGSIVGKLFGDEFDLPIENASLSGNTLTFTVTSTNYYSREKVTFQFRGTCKENEIELTRERVLPPGDKTQKKSAAAPKPFLVKRLTSQKSSAR